MSQEQGLSFAVPVILREYDPEPGHYLLVDLSQGRAYKLTDTAHRAAQLLTAGTSRAALLAALTSEYKASREHVAEELEGFLDLLNGQGLLSRSEP